jgi:hypothetical protein
MLIRGEIVRLKRLRASLCQRTREFRGGEKRTSAAEAGYGSFSYGTAQAVPFFKTEFSRRLLSALVVCRRSLLDL